MNAPITFRAADRAANVVAFHRPERMPSRRRETFAYRAAWVAALVAACWYGASALAAVVDFSLARIREVLP